MNLQARRAWRYKEREGSVVNFSLLNLQARRACRYKGREGSAVNFSLFDLRHFFRGLFWDNKRVENSESSYWILYPHILLCLLFNHTCELSPEVPDDMLQQKVIQFFQYQKDGKWVTTLLLGGEPLTQDDWCWTVGRAQNKLTWIVCYNEEPP